jgi:hypothetical protein
MVMVKKAWEGQFTGQPKPAEHQDDLFTPVRGNHPGHWPVNCPSHAFFTISRSSRRGKKTWPRIDWMVLFPQSILGQVFFPRLLDRLMVKKAWEGQFTGQPKPAPTPAATLPGRSALMVTALRRAPSLKGPCPG